MPQHPRHNHNVNILRRSLNRCSMSGSRATNWLDGFWLVVRMQSRRWLKCEMDCRSSLEHYSNIVSNSLKTKSQIKCHQHWLSPARVQPHEIEMSSLRNIQTSNRMND